MPPAVGERAPEFEALRCDGETFRTRSLAASLHDRGGVLVFFGFAFSAIARNWWKRYDRRGWADLPVPVFGVSRDGPYAQNAFLRSIGGPFAAFSDVDGTAADAYDLLVTRDGMGGTRTAKRAVFVLDGDRTVQERWVAEDWVTPPPVERLETAARER